MPRSGGCRDGEGESRVVAGDEATTLESPREKRPASVRQRVRVRLLARRSSRNIRRRPRRRTGRRSVQEGAIRLRRELGYSEGPGPGFRFEGSCGSGTRCAHIRRRCSRSHPVITRWSVLLRHRLPQVPQLRVDREIGFGENFTIIDTLPRFRSGATASIEVTHADRPSAAGTVRYEMTFHHQHAIRRKKSIQFRGLFDLHEWHGHGFVGQLANPWTTRACPRRRGHAARDRPRSSTPISEHEPTSSQLLGLFVSIELGPAKKRSFTGGLPEKMWSGSLHFRYDLKPPNPPASANRPAALAGSRSPGCSAPSAALPRLPPLTNPP